MGKSLGMWASVLACLGAVEAAAQPVSQPVGQTISFVDQNIQRVPQSEQWDGAQWSTANLGSTDGAAINWQVMAPNPNSNERSVLSQCSDYSLYLQQWSGTSWGLASKLSNSTGTATLHAFSCAYEQTTTGRLITAYRNNKDKAVYYRLFTGVGFPPEQKWSYTMTTVPTYISLIPKPSSAEVLMLAFAGANLYAGVWNGSTFVGSTTLETTMNTTGRPFSGAYMTQSGRAMVVWGPNSGAPKYATWNGTSWSGASTLPNPGSTTPWITVAANPAALSNELLWGCITSTKTIMVNRWNGTSWGANTIIDSPIASAVQHRMEIAYQHDGKNALLVWHHYKQTNVMYELWNGAAWSGPKIGPEMGVPTKMITLAKGDQANTILMASKRRTATPVVTDYVLYSKAGIVNPGTADVNGDFDQAVAGVVSPTAPPHTAGVLDLVFPSGTTAAIPPGAYGALTIGDNCAINLTHGSYIFKSVAIGNGTTLSGDTSLGDVDIITSTATGFTAGNSLTIGPRDPDDPGDVMVDVWNGPATVGSDCKITTATFSNYRGTVSIGANAAITSLVYAKGNISITSGTVDPSDSLTPGGQLIATTWTDGVPGTPMGLCDTVAGSGNVESFSLVDQPLGNIFVTRWREVGQDE